MTRISDYISEALKYIATIGVSDILDILIVAALIYWFIGFIRKTSATKVAKGIIALILALWISDVLKLTVVNFLLRKAFEIGLLALVILFQPEIRRALEKIGTSRFSWLIDRTMPTQSLETTITQTVLACADMSISRTGALIIFERDNLLKEEMSTGTMVDAEVSAELLKNIFFNKAPLHDGAVIIRSGRIAAAGCVLPLSNNNNLSRDLGMRHRAGIGVSEKSDALVVIVSEETGAISVATEGMLKRHLTVETFEKLLTNALMPKAEPARKWTFPGKRRGNNNEK